MTLPRTTSLALLLATLVLVFFMLLIVTARAGTAPDFPVLSAGDLAARPGEPPTPLAALSEEMARQGLTVLPARTTSEALGLAEARMNLGAAVLDADSLPDWPEALRGLRAMLPELPVFLLSARLGPSSLSAEVLREIDGFLRAHQDRPAFAAGTVRSAAADYRDRVLPPFFKALAAYVEDSNYPWATPGHGGGAGFRASPAGAAFAEFFGDNIFRADLSSSMGELGSLLEHSGPAGEAEKQAAAVFGADLTFFVLGGTSTSNKVVWQGRVSPGDIVLVDRNCHKSLMHAIVMTRALPVFLTPSRNGLGIIGPIPQAQFDGTSIRRAVERSPLIRDKAGPIRIFVLTNTTYDGLSYNAQTVKDRTGSAVQTLHFDEAWYGYARFHPLYAGRYAMGLAPSGPADPPVFATQSTHKVLAAFSQGSMVHLKQGGRERIDPEVFNEPFLMYASTSPFYPMFASLDVSARMMSGASGRRIMDETLAEAVAFRKKVAAMASDPALKDGWFGVWQPEGIAPGKDGKGRAKTEIPTEKLLTSQEHWLLAPGADWHGFSGLAPGEVMLDPLKVTLTTPGAAPDGTMAEKGVPAGIVARYLSENGIVPEKVGHYSFLVLFTPGVSKGKSATLLTRLADFQDLYRRNAPLEEAFPALVRQHPQRYAGLRLKELCDRMHAFFRERKLTGLLKDMYATLPEQRIIPAEAYDRLVRGRAEDVPVEDLTGRTVLTMLVPYPPGIPLVMPGEALTAENRAVLDYFRLAQETENLFPGFETEIHGVKVGTGRDGRKVYTVHCAVD